MNKNQRNLPSIQFLVKYKRIIHPEIENLSEDDIINFISERLCDEVMKNLGEFNQDKIGEITTIAFNITQKYLNCGYEIESMEVIDEIPSDN